MTDSQGHAGQAPATISPASNTGCRPGDLLFDPLTFTICTGNEDDRKLGLCHPGGDRAHRRRSFPRCQIILGLSNISFGLNPAARHVLNSVFLDHAHEAAA